MRNSFDPTTPSFFHGGNHRTPVPFYAFISNLEMRFPFQEGGL
jgi:hypothetical protein